MKRILYIVLAASVLLAGCKGTDEPSPETLSVNPELITCPDAGGDYTLTLTSPNGAWSAATNESWIRVTPTSGKAGTAEVRIKISPNKESAETKGEVTFTSGNETLQLPITRAAKAAPYLRIVSEKALNTPKEGGSYTVQIESNIKWSASSNVGWAKVNKGVSVNNDNITVTVSPATTPEETTATITIAPYGEGEAAGTQQVTITRGSTEATSLSVDPTEIKAPENGGSFSVNVSSNAKWRVWKTWDMDWLTLSGSQDGDGNGSFSFSIEAAASTDAISGIITIEEVREDNYPPVKVEVAVTRAGKAAASLSVVPNSIDAPMGGGEYPIYILSNYPWTIEQVESTSDFFSLSTTSGNGDATVIVTVRPLVYNREDDATATLVIRTSFGDEQAIVNIRRKSEWISYYSPKPFTIGNKRLYFSPANLQYQPSTDTWRFAPRQYDMIGNDNSNISPSYNGWIDLFGWGTGNNPTQCSTNDNDYQTFTDWGINSVSDDGSNAGQWRTLTNEEWSSLLIFHAGLGTVNGVKGMILVPDDWRTPSGQTFTPIDVNRWYYGDYEYMDLLDNNHFTDNIYSAGGWAEMEKAGAVFLPATGCRLGNDNLYDVGRSGYYWSSTPFNSEKAERLYFSYSKISVKSNYCTYGCAVRLVRDADGLK